MRSPLRLLFAVVPVVVAMPGARAELSPLWGKTGENWSPTSRIPDYAFAGYARGEKPLPDYPVRKNVRDYGAKGDGKTDDTAAFRKALAAIRSGALLVPAGRYVVTDYLDLTASGIVLRGEGPDKTTLYFPDPLSKKYPHPTQNSGGTPTQAWSWSGGFIRISGERARDAGAGVPLTADAARGTYAVTVASTAGLSAGTWVALREADPGDLSFVNYLYAGDPGNTKNFPKNHSFRYPLKIKSVTGTKVTFDEALPLDFRKAWGATLAPYSPGIRQSGIEHLRVEFPATPYGGHFREAGYNPFQLTRAADCWLRDITIANADSGPMIGDSDYCTLDGLVWISERKPAKGNLTGHHGMILGGTHNLVSNFEFRTRFVHDLTVSSGSYFNVFSRGKGVDLALDHHERAPTGNLFTDIDLGAGTRAFLCGGGSALGRNCGAYAVFWNLRSQAPQPFPKREFSPRLITVVGVKAAGKPVMKADGEWYEPTASPQPANLYEAQLKRRLGR